MAHLISEDQIERLADLKGVANFDEWKSQLENAPARIELQIQGTVEQAWKACLPTWIELGRVLDFSVGARITRYWPSYARELGMAFTEKFQKNYLFLVGVLREEAANSYEYLCAFDLLHLIASDFAQVSGSIPGDILGIELPVPAVVACEVRYEDSCKNLSTIGEMLQWFVENE